MRFFVPMALLALGGSASAQTPEVLPRPDFHFAGSVSRTYLDSDKARRPQPVQPY